MDEGWGRRAVDFATLSEPANVREYLALHQALDVGPGDRVLDLACGAGLAVELAGVRGAACAGIDASERLVAVARDRSPEADLRVGDMHDLPWVDGAFDVERIEVPFVWEFADPEAYARALASTGPAYEAIQAVGEDAFRASAVAAAAERMREGLPLRAPIAVVGYVARAPIESEPGEASGAGSVAVPGATPAAG